MFIPRLYITCFLLGLLASGMFAQDSLKTVVAQKGDGIYSLLRKQGLDPAAYYSDFVTLNEHAIRNNRQLFEGRMYLIPHGPNPGEALGNVAPLNTGTEYPIFGSTYAMVTAKSNRLNGAVYYLISGHGGPDPGAIENYNGKTIAEDEYAYDVTLRLARELLSHGAKVFVIVRDADDGIRDESTLELDRDEVIFPNKSIPRKQLARLQQRVEVVNSLYLKNSDKYQRLIVTHVDSRSRGQNIDVFFYHHEKSRNGKHLAESIHKTFEKKYKRYQPNRHYSGTFSDRSNLYMVKNTLPAMAYIEIGNIRSSRDQRRIFNPNNRQALAKWISEGVLLDFESQK